MGTKCSAPYSKSAMNPVLSGKNCRVALAQLATGLDKQANIRSAIAAIKRAKEQGAEIVVLPVSAKSCRCLARPLPVAAIGMLQQPVRHKLFR